MKKCLLLFLCFCTFFAFAGNPRRRTVISGSPERISEVELVLDNPVPVVKWASQRLQGYLELAMGSKPAIVAEPTGKFAIVLGAGKLASEAGIDVSSLPLEGYVMLRKGNRLFLCGKDSATNAPQFNRWAQRYERGTLSAMYDFMERFADAVFVFPNQYGEVVPPKGALFLPSVIDILECPDFEVRTHYIGHNAKGALDKGSDGVQAYNELLVSGRWSEYSIPFTHGLNGLRFTERFSKDHPEYFAMMPNGKRYNTPDLKHSGHFCFSNKGFRDEVYGDLKAYFTGQASTTRNLPYWPGGTFSEGRYASVMPQDWYYACCCPECAKLGKGERFYQYGEPKEERLKAGKAFSTQLWEFTKDMADRLTADGIKASVTQMAYGVTVTPPDFALPENLEIQVAVSGLGCRRNWQKDLELLKTWNAKTGKKLSIWTYPGKHMHKAEMVGIPAEMHSQMHEYFNSVQPYITGAFIEEETDFFLFVHLNTYVYSHYAWDNSIDVSALLSKYYRVMYGPAADVMKSYFDTLEHLWCDRIIGNTVESALGPVPVLPSIHQVWRDIYSAKQMADFEALFDKAEKLAQGDKAALARVRYIRSNFHGPIKAAYAKYQETAQGFANWNVEYGKKLCLRSCLGAKAGVRTWFSFTDEKDALVLDVECEEPDMAHSKADTPADKLDGNAWEDSDVEFLINPSGDRKNYYQFAVNSNGALYDSRCGQAGMGKAWNSGATVKAQKLDKSWTARISIPKAAFPGGLDTSRDIPVNCARHRVVGTQVEDYQWTPSEGKNFHDILRWGVVTHKPSGNILLNPDFTQEGKVGPEKWSVWMSGGANGGQSYALDKEIYMTGGQSIRLENVADMRMNAGQRFRVKAGATCKLSYYIRCQNMDISKTNKGINAGRGAGAYIHTAEKEYPLPQTKITDNTEWIRQEFTFKAGTKNPDADGTVPCTVGLWNWNCQGTVWFDAVSITVEE